MINLNKVNIIDNFLPQHFQNYLYNKYTKNHPWVLTDLEGNTTFGNKLTQNQFIDENSSILDTIQENFQFSNIILLNGQLISPNSEDTDVLSLFHYIQILVNYSYKVIPIRLKSNLQVPSPYPNKKLHNTPHIDHDKPLPNFYTLIYYVNNSDGDTIVFNEKYQGTPIKNFTINQRVSPQQGKAILFPTHQYHCGSSPVDSKGRIVMNLNFQLLPL